MVSCEKELLWFQKNTVLTWWMVDLSFQQAWWRLRFWSSLCKGRADTGGWWNVLQIKTWPPSWRRTVSGQELLTTAIGVRFHQKPREGTSGKDFEFWKCNGYRKLPAKCPQLPAAWVEDAQVDSGRSYQDTYLLCQKPPAWPSPPGEWWHLLIRLLDSSGCYPWDAIWKLMQITEWC